MVTQGAEKTNTKDKGKGVISRGFEEVRTAAVPKWRRRRRENKCR
jgi:hypothetical protein